MKNMSTAILLLDPRVRAIAVTYEKIDYDENTTKQMKYTPAYLANGKLPSGAVLFKSMDQDLEVGNFVIVPTNTRHGMTVCKVVGVDVPVDYDSDDEVYWIVGKVDTTEFEQIRQDEEKVILAMRKSADEKRRAAAREAFMEGLPNDLPMIGGAVSPAPVPTVEEAVDPDYKPGF